MEVRKAMSAKRMLMIATSILQVFAVGSTQNYNTMQPKLVLRKIPRRWRTYCCFLNGAGSETQTLNDMEESSSYKKNKVETKQIGYTGK